MSITDKITDKVYNSIRKDDTDIIKEKPKKIKKERRRLTDIFDESVVYSFKASLMISISLMVLAIIRVAIEQLTPLIGSWVQAIITLGE